jgi:ketosteroid isomerase-like protein
MKISKRTRLRIASPFIAALIAFVPAAKPQVKPEKPPDIGAVWASDWSARRLDHIMTLYTSDAVFFTLDDRFAGTASIRDMFRKTLETNTATIHLHRVIAEQSGNLAHESGNYEETLVSSGQKREVRGHYLMVLRKEAGRWLIAEQMWTESTKPPEKSTISR